MLTRERLLDWPTLVAAYHRARAGKRHDTEVAAWFRDWESRLVGLRERVAIGAMSLRTRALFALCFASLAACVEADQAVVYDPAEAGAADAPAVAVSAFGSRGAGFETHATEVALEVSGLLQEGQSDTDDAAVAAALAALAECLNAEDAWPEEEKAGGGDEKGTDRQERLPCGERARPCNIGNGR